MRCRHPEAGETEFPAAAVEAMAALGWEAISEPRTWSQAQDEATHAAQQAPASVPASPPAVAEQDQEQPPPAAEQPTTRDRRRAASDKEE